MKNCQNYRFIILGAQSSIGYSMLHNLSNSGIDFLAFSSSENSQLGFLPYEKLNSSIVTECIVIDLRGWTNLEACEVDKVKSFKKNCQDQLDFYYKYNKYFSKYIYFSSASVSSGPNGLPASQYAKDKYKLEKQLKLELKALGLRIHSTYGPFQRKMFVYECAQSLIKQSKFISKGTLSGSRDLIHQDVFSSILFLNHLINTSSIIELRTGNVVKVKDVANLIAGYLGGTVTETSKHNYLNPDFFPYSNNISSLVYPGYSFPYELTATLDAFKGPLSYRLR